MAKQTEKFTFSIIMPIYNVERFLSEAIDSVVNQTIGFERHIQLILVNDGSPDNSEEICLRYKEKYPSNITYIKKKNGGVSDARNKGLEAAVGKYVGFLDPDDKVSEDCYKKVIDFFNSHQKVDVVSISIFFFGTHSGPHAVNDKFNPGTRVVDLSETDSQFVQSNTASTFIRRSIIGEVKFDKRLKYGEDGKFINEILLKSLRLGLLAESTYYYRKRDDGSSAVDGMTYDKRWYLDIIKFYLKDIAETAKKKYGVVPVYVQNIILHDLRWRFQQTFIQPGVLSEKELLQYGALIKEILQSVDDTRILKFSYISGMLRVYILAFKHGLSFDEFIVNEEEPAREDKGLVELRSMDLLTQRPIFVDFIDEDGEDLIIKGWYDGYVNNTTRSLKAVVNGEPMDVELSKRITDPIVSMGEIVKYKYDFKIRLSARSLDGNMIFGIKLITPDGEYDLKQIFGYHSRLTSVIKYSYKVLGKRLLSVDYIDGIPCLKIEPNKWRKCLTYEMRYSIRVLKRRDFLSFGARIVGGIIRKLAELSGKEVWLFMDRPTTATDNGFTMFDYIIKHHRKKIYPLFILAKESDNWEKVKQVGPVADFGRMKHKVYLYAATKVLSSHFDGYVFNPYGRRAEFMRVGMTFDLVYLQHGVLAQDLSDLINRPQRNIKLITVSSTVEKDSIVNNPKYQYGDGNIAITGQARFDNLYDKSSLGNKTILFAPTWRSDLRARPQNVDGRTLPGRNQYSPIFRKTDYFKFYDKLINDSRLLNAMERNGYVGKYCVHPQFSSQASDFHANSKVEVVSSFDYNELLEEANLLITDYSGVAFDFAYMKKPIIYSQFDIKDFYKGHTYSAGYFDFKSHGFGRVETDYDSTITAIIRLLEEGCTISPKYEKRINTFFYKIDHENCKRIYTVLNT